MTRLFVYGTLKSGESNHAFLAGQTLVGPARTGPGFTLFSLGDYPGLVTFPSDRAGVAGELWSIDAACLARIDVLEGIGEGLYRRGPISLAAPAAAPGVETYFYLRDLINRPRLGAMWPG